MLGKRAASMWTLYHIVLAFANLRVGQSGTVQMEVVMALSFERYVPDGDSRHAVHPNYDMFSMYRHALAEAAADIVLADMEGYGGDVTWPDVERQPLTLLLRKNDDGAFIERWECELMFPVLQTFVVPDSWEPWMKDLHDGIVSTVCRVATDGGIVRIS